MYSDGNTLLAPGKSYVYHFGHGGDSSIETYFDVPEELHYLKKLGKHETWRTLPHSWFRKNYGYLLADRYCFDLYEHEEEEDPKMIEAINIMNKSKVENMTSIGQKYYLDLDTFGDDLVKLYNFYDNFHPMSAEFRPHVLYMTPQCGEYEMHQKMLEKFAEINKSYCQEEEE
jgi:hypothetical protein